MSPTLKKSQTKVELINIDRKEITHVKAWLKLSLHTRRE